MNDLTVQCQSDVTMSTTAPVEHLCPFVDEVDYGTVTIVWFANGSTFELHALRTYLDGFKDSRLSHEELTDRVRHDLSVLPGVELIRVESTWETAGMEVRCSTSPTLAGRL